jgi:hypothetical protein
MFSLFLQDAWKVLLYSLLLGAGLPIVYAVGVRSLGLAFGGRTVEDGAGEGAGERHPLGVALATICFAVVLAGVALGLLYIVAAGQGKMLSFGHVYPTMVPKS